MGELKVEWRTLISQVVFIEWFHSHGAFWDLHRSTNIITDSILILSLLSNSHLIDHFAVYIAH